MWRHATSLVTSLHSLPIRQAAVIDIGSNSVRLVTYQLEGRAIWTVYNEKALAGLGKGVATTGRLSPEGVATALDALRRYQGLLEDWNPSDVFVVATAAVREATDGQDFLRLVETKTGLSVRVLSGEEEAHYAALGVIAGQADAEGVVGDMGGSSLELIKLHDRGQGISLPLGPFALGAPGPIDIDRVRKIADRALSPISRQFQTKQFHAVGGAWRNLALLHMALSGYPLHVAHQYEISRTDALEVANFVARQSRNSLEGIQGLSKKRFDTLPYAAAIMGSVIEHLGLETIVVSAFGLREGLLYESMSKAERDRDPLVEGCAALTAHQGIADDMGVELESFVSPLFSALPPLFGVRDRILQAAACRLANLGARLHPDHRADLAFDKALRAPIAGMNHAERAFLASAIFARHASASLTPEPETISRILSPERRQRARALGTALRLGCDIAGRNGTVLGHVHMDQSKGDLRLKTDPGREAILLGEQTVKRATSLAQALKLKLQLG